jgi:hypothetical protein
MSINKKFLNSVKRGTGEAYLLIMNNPNIDFSDEIIDGATTNYAYDAQCEGSRGAYIYGLINLANTKNAILNQLIEAFDIIENDHYGLDQLYEILCLCALNGNEIAKKHIVDRFEKDSENDFWEGETSILKLFNVDGLKLILEKKGKLYAKLGDDFDDDSYYYLIDNFQKENPLIDVIKQIELFSESNDYLKIYLEKYKANKSDENKPREKRSLDYLTISNKIRNGGYFFFDKSEISEDDVLKISDDFLKEKEKIMLENYLNFFSDIKFPKDYNFIFDILQNFQPDKSRLTENAIEALSFFKSNELREYALQKLSEKKDFEIYTNLLIRNYEKGDYQILSKVIKPLRNQDKIHSFLCSYIDIFKKNKTFECKEPLEILYNKTTCGLHRIDIIEILKENDVLSSRIIEEIQYDCDKKIREIYFEIQKKVQLN